MMSEILGLNIEDSKMLESFGEFDEPPPMPNSTFCQKISEDQYEQQAVTETEKALLELMNHLEQDSSTFYKTLCKRKKEEQESGGPLSFLKVKLLEKIQGPNYKGNQVSESEYEEKLQGLKDGIVKAYNYSQESKGKRFSQRLAAKKARLAAVNDENSEPATIKPKQLRTGTASYSSCQAMPPPPPPPIPTGGFTPVQHKMVTSTPIDAENRICCRRPLRDINRVPGLLVGVHDELLSTNALKKLKTTGAPRSPGGTPIRARGRKMEPCAAGSPHPLNRSESLTQAFLKVMEEKFRNIRSPSPASRTLDSTGFYTSPECTP